MSKPETFRSEDEREVILAVLKLPAGYNVELFGLLYVRGLEDGRFAVGSETAAWEREFSTVEEAVDDFLSARRLMELGLDYEKEEPE